MCLSPGLLEDAPLFSGAEAQCACVNMISSVRRGSSFNPSDRLNPCENTAAAAPYTSATGAATPASSPSSRMLHEISGRSAVMQGHA